VPPTGPNSGSTPLQALLNQLAQQAASQQANQQVRNMNDLAKNIAQTSSGHDGQVFVREGCVIKALLVLLFCAVQS
jgi:hypothetical protein